MAELSNVRHENFAQEYVRRGNATKAYMAVYPDSGYDAARGSASTLLANPNIKARVEELKKRSTAELLEEIGLTRQAVLEMALQTYKDARSYANQSAQIKTVELIGRELDLFTPKVRTEQKIESEVEFTIDMGKEVKSDG